jgi:hypothetical protein
MVKDEGILVGNDPLYCVCHSYGGKSWYRHGNPHRRVAYQYVDGNKFWYDEDGIHHREDGPAYELACGDQRWFWHGELVNVTSQQEFESWLRLKAFW